MVSGWACQKHLAAPIDVHVYVGGKTGTLGVFPTIALANGPSEPAVAASCGTASVKHRFAITLPNNPTGKIYVYGEPTLILEQGALLAAAVSVDGRGEPRRLSMAERRVALVMPWRRDQHDGWCEQGAERLGRL